MRRGTFTLVVLRQQAAGGRVLRSGRLGPLSSALSSNGHRRKRWSNRGVARKRRPGRAVTFEVSLCGVLAAPYGWFRRNCGGSQHSRPFFDRGRSSCPKGRGEGEGRFGVTAKAGRSKGKARIGCSGVCPCVGSAVAEVVGRQPDPEKRLSTLRVNIAKRDDGRGRGSSAQWLWASRKRGSKVLRVNGRRGPSSSRKHT